MVLFTPRSQRARNIAAQEQLLASSQIPQPIFLRSSRASQGSPVPGPSKQPLGDRNVAHPMLQDISFNSDQDEDFRAGIEALNLQLKSGILLDLHVDWHNNLC